MRMRVCVCDVPTPNTCFCSGTPSLLAPACARAACASATKCASLCSSTAVSASSRAATHLCNRTISRRHTSWPLGGRESITLLPAGTCASAVMLTNASLASDSCRRRSVATTDLGGRAYTPICRRNHAHNTIMEHTHSHIHTRTRTHARANRGREGDRTIASEWR